MSVDAVGKDEDRVWGVVRDDLETACALFLGPHFVFGQKVFPGRRGWRLGGRDGRGRAVGP